MLLLFFFNDTATTEIYTLSLHDALPIFDRHRPPGQRPVRGAADLGGHVPGAERVGGVVRAGARSEEHTSELQSRQYLVCRLLLEKKKQRLPVYKTQLPSNHHRLLPSYSE